MFGNTPTMSARPATYTLTGGKEIGSVESPTNPVVIAPGSNNIAENSAVVKHSTKTETPVPEQISVVTMLFMAAAAYYIYKRVL